MSDWTPTYNYVYQPYPANEGDNIYSVSGPDIKPVYPAKRMTKKEAEIEADRLNKLNGRSHHQVE